MSMATTDVEFVVPVVARVNLETGEVERVHVADEEIEVNDDWLNEPDRTDDERRATEIADDPQTGWPAWEFGF